MERVNEIERQINELRKVLSDPRHTADVSYKIHCLEQEKGSLLRYLRERGEI